ncbi:hypothetical protein HN51_041357, partial [Arachis hypogaea]
DYFSVAPPSDIGGLEPKKISLAVSDIKVATRRNKKIPRREPENMRRVHVLYFQRLKHGPLRACQVPEPWIVEWTTNELDKKADHVISQGCIVNNAKKEIKKKKKQSSSKAINEKERCKKPLKDPDQSPSTQGKTTSQPSYKEANKVIYFLYDRSCAHLIGSLLM